MFEVKSITSIPNNILKVSPYLVGQSINKIILIEKRKVKIQIRFFPFLSKFAKNSQSQKFHSIHDNFNLLTRCQSILTLNKYDLLSVCLTKLTFVIS